MCLRGDFRAQVEQILERQQLKEEDYDAINKAIKDIEWVLQTRWPGSGSGTGSQLTPFGSVVMGLGRPGSDIDCYIHVPDPAPNTILIEEAASILRQYPELFTDIYLSGDRIPIVNAKHVPSHRDIDLSFTGPSSISNTQLLKYLFHRESIFLELAVVVQYWTKVHRLDDNMGYTFRHMVIFFLQQKGLLPPVAALQQNVAPLLMDHWNTSFEERNYNTSDYALFNLLVDFFEYYANYNYKRDVISPFVGYPFNKTKFEHLRTLPEELVLYKHNVKYNITGPIFFNSHIVVQEVFDHNRNLAGDINDTLAEKIITAFRAAYDVYRRNKNPDVFLKSILLE